METSKKPKTSLDTVSGHSPFLTEAYNLTDEQSIKAFYTRWAEAYDQQMIDTLAYRSPFIIADLLQQYLTDTAAAILDIGCGTGLTAKQLYAAGYSQLQGLDFSAEMIEVSRSRGFYQKLSTADVNVPLIYADATFDAIISSGTFTHSHVDAKPLPEILRIIKPGGFLVCTVHADRWIVDGFATMFAELEQRGLISCLYREMGAYYVGKAPEGWFCVYQKTA